MKSVPCPKCGTPDPIVGDCGYSSFNAGWVKCTNKQCEYEVRVSPCGAFPEEELIKAWNSNAAKVKEALANTFYKVKHIASGLFYRPSKGAKDINLSKNGKVYQRKPSPKSLDPVRLGFGKIGKPFDWQENKKELLRAFRKNEWELVQFTTTQSVVPW